MTPADRAMRDALNESVQEARSPARRAPTLRPLFHESRINLTSFAPSGYRRPGDVDQSLCQPNKPHTPSDQFRQYERSLDSSSTPLDYKRVRRKQSSFDLSSPPRDLDDWPLSNTSFSPLFPSPSPQAYFPHFQPPPPLLPPFRSSHSSPSLSSTVDTLPSTPPHTPFQRVELSFDQWSSGRRSELSEALRTKRKFPQLKVAKRLPHPSRGQESGEEGIWEVHAAVIDLGETKVVESDSSQSTVREHVIRSEETPPRPSTAGKKGRTVRFEDLSAPEHSFLRTPSSSPSPPSPLRPTRSKSTANDEQTQSSSYTLSKFKFPAPPGYTWAGTFGHLTETPPPTSPASPATLHYRGVSFDVVNPHASLLLGYTDFETPAEIDGLLDDYFNRSTLSLKMAGTPPNEASASQVSLNNSTSSGRQRVLYDDPMSARRNIMNLPPAPPQRMNASTPNVDSPTLPTLHQNIAQLSRARSHEPLRDDIRTETPLHLPLSRFAVDGFESVPVTARPATAPNVGEAVVTTPQYPLHIGYPGDDGAPQTGTVRRTPFGSFRTYANGRANRASSMYPETEVSYPFDLESLGDDESTAFHQDNVRGSIYDIGNPRETGEITDARFDAGRESYYDDRNEASREDVEGEASATQSMNDPDTVANLVGLYQHRSGPYTYQHAGQRAEIVYDTESISVEDACGPYRMSRNPYFGAYDHAQLGGHATGGDYRQLRLPIGMGRLPPSTLPPTPRHPPDAHIGFSRFRSLDSDLPTTDQTYGNTTPLLGLTPRPGTHQYAIERPYAPSLGSHPFDVLVDDSPMAQLPSRRQGNPFTLRPDDKKENMLLSFSDVSLADSNASISSEDIAAPSLGDVRRRRPLLEASTSNTLPQSAEQLDENASVWEDMDSMEEGDSSPTHPSTNVAESGSVGGIRGAIRSLGRGISEIFAPSPVDTSARAPAEQSAGRRGSHTGRERSHEEEVVDILLRKSNHAASIFDMHRLEQLRTQHPTAHQRGVATAERAMAASLRKDERIGGSKKNILNKILGRNGSSPEEERLLGPPQAAVNSPGSLQYSETAGTFATSRPPPALIRGVSATIAPSVPAPFTPTAQRRGVTEHIEMTPLSRPPTNFSRPAVSGQRRLRRLVLGGRHRIDSPDPGTLRGDGVTTTAPQSHGQTPSFGIVQSDGNIEHVRLLMNPREGRNLGTRRLQKRLTKPWVRLCGLFPITAVGFGLGGFDWWIAKKTDGEIEEMDPEAKRKALLVWAPMGFIAWAILACVVAILVVASKI